MGTRAGKIAKPVADAVQGFLFLPRGLGYLVSHSDLWPYAVLPLVINIAIIALLGGLAFFFFPEIRSLIWDRPDNFFLEIAWFLLNVVLVIAMLFVLFLLFIFLSGVIAGPFNSKLARYTRESLTGRKLDPAGGFYIDVIITLVNEVKKLVYFTLLQIAILPLNLIPGIGSVAYAVIGGYLTFVFLAYAFLEKSIESENWVISMKQRRQYLRSRRWAVLGFGAAASLIFVIPFLNIFLAPVAVVGAAMLYESYGCQSGLPFGKPSA